MPTKWLQERPNGSKNVLGIGFGGPGVEDAERDVYPGAQYDPFIKSARVQFGEGESERESAFLCACV